jgi:hypothetical protein
MADRMVRHESGAWHCPVHALLLAARHLVSLYRAEGEADWTAICEIIGETLPDIVAKTEHHDRPLPPESQRHRKTADPKGTTTHPRNEGGIDDD